jgi:hypothetical protein
MTDPTTGSRIREALGDGSEWGLELVHVEDDGALDPFASPTSPTSSEPLRCSCTTATSC